MFRNSDYFEGLPLRRSSQFGIRQHSLKGPSRVIRLCLLGVMLPTLLIAIPLYLRYRVYRHQLYPLAMSDMRIIDGRISTIWCQRQLVRANMTFNAFLLPETPTISDRHESLSLVRHLLLEDDMKEYWGFYLLKGSVVKVSTCVRWPGASLIVIRGHKHLQECAYIGDNSSEELAELVEEKKADGPANRPDEMRRHRQDVQFVKPVPSSLSSNKSLINHDPEFPDEDVSDTGDIKKILDNLQNKTKILNKEKNKKSGMRNSTEVDKNKLSINNSSPVLSNLTSEEMIEDIMSKLGKLGDKGADILNKLNKKFKEISTQEPISTTLASVQQIIKREIGIAAGTEEQDNVGQEEGFNPERIENRHTQPEMNQNDMSNSEFWSSFSSSEEALLNCDGLILNLPLDPHHKCSANLTNEQAEEAHLQNTFIYKVPLNGYYFFVFSSENEVQQNYVRVQIDLQKTLYDVSKPLAKCSNTSTNCSLDLQFLSGQKVVLQLPLQNNDDYFDEEFVAESECEPRSELYAICVIAVPVVFILFAFT
ncbi:hypothetical protein HHI36_003526 [Cryptolaemus montrouzieri]|uniref:E3 ubiquitin-protein ligase APD1-4 middle domain-containing protein n=1 Tax=Cryptolaemus montrouzieri TaxID=559131 RepID=A0ABD2PDN4_9CUCU